MAEYPPSERADMFDLDRLGRTPTEGRHRAIRQHAFVPHPRGEEFGCNRTEDDEPHVRCGYFRKNHPTMLGVGNG